MGKPPTKVPGGLTKSILIRIDPPLLARLDAYVSRRSHWPKENRPSRADIVREAIEHMIEGDDS